MPEPQRLLSSVCLTLISSNSRIYSTYEHVIATTPLTKLRSLWRNQNVGSDEELVMQATIATQTLMTFSTSKFQTQNHFHGSGRATHYCCPWQERLKGLCILASFAFFRNLLDLASPFLPFPCHHLIPCKWYFLSLHLSLFFFFFEAFIFWRHCAVSESLATVMLVLYVVSDGASSSSRLPETPWWVEGLQCIPGCAASENPGVK